MFWLYLVIGMSHYNLFNHKEDYNEILEKLRKEFEYRWAYIEPSPSSNLEKFIQKAVLGTGSFGTVLLIKEKNSKNHYAAKMMNKEDLVRLKQVAHVHNEKNVLHSMRFPFVIHLIYSSKDYDYLYLVLPFVNGGELFTYHRKLRKFNEKQSRFYAAQVILALEYMHRMNVMYRDLKPENILLDQRGYIKMADFGFAKRVESRTTTLCGTPEYLAPEIIQLKPYTKSVDLWAFGVLVYEFVVGRSPFSANSRDVIMMYAKICSGDFRMPAYLTNHLRSFIDELLSVDVSKRLGHNSIKDIKDHSWFSGIDWFALLNQEIIPPYLPAVTAVEDLSNFDHYEPKLKVKSRSNRHAELFTNF